jgi:hypothetical protein
MLIVRFNHSGSATGGVAEPIRVGSEYQEELRRYLVGEVEFPENAACVIYISTSQTPPLSAGYPDSLQDGSVSIHRFYVPGVWFLLVFGDLTDDQRKMCILRSVNHPLCLLVHGDALAHSICFNLSMTNKQL